MSEATREQMIRVGVDLAKNVIQVHGVDRSGRKIAAKPIRRDQFLSSAAQLPPGAWWRWKRAQARTPGRDDCGGSAWMRA